MLGDQVRRAARRVAHHEHVGLHRREIVHVSSRVLALGRAGGIDIEIDDVGRQRLAAISKVVAGARRILEEQVEDLLPRSSGSFFTSRSATSVKARRYPGIAVSISRGKTLYWSAGAAVRRGG